MTLLRETVQALALVTLAVLAALGFLLIAPLLLIAVPLTIIAAAVAAPSKIDPDDGKHVRPRHPSNRS